MRGTSFTIAPMKRRTEFFFNGLPEGARSSHHLNRSTIVTCCGLVQLLQNSAQSSLINAYVTVQRIGIRVYWRCLDQPVTMTHRAR